MPEGNDPKLAETLDAPVYEPPKAGPRAGRRRWWILVVLALLVCLAGWLMAKSGSDPASPLPSSVSTEVNGLRFTLAAVRPPNAGPYWLDIRLTARNVSGERLIVLPHAGILKVEGRGARFQGLPLSPVPPWTDARAIAPGEETSAGSFGLLDRQIRANAGAWLLELGSYKVSVSYEVTPAQLPSPEQLKRLPGMMPDGKVWLGAVTCGPIEITVVPPKPAAGGGAGGQDAGSR